MNEVHCPICGAVHQGTAQQHPGDGDYSTYNCDVCGKFRVSGTASRGTNPELGRLSLVHRALLSHRLRQGVGNDCTQLVTVDSLLRIQREKLPSPSIQAANLIRVIGDWMSIKGEPFVPDKTTPATIGSINSTSFNRLLSQLITSGTILDAGDSHTDRGGHTTIARAYDLTLGGWEKYEAEKNGKFSGRYGFIALPFDEPGLDPFFRDVVKPVVKEKIGYDLYDMRDVPQAGVIDNIMRIQIRDSAFVLVDLTHGNSGAYWEAGYAEGLGKPVIYLCEKEKFKEARTHFDTNHCTTILWCNTKHEDFKDELIATLRRSLNLFPIADA